MGSLLVFAVKLFGRLVVKAGLEPTEHAERVFLSAESVKMFCKTNKQEIFKKMRELLPGASIAEIKDCIARGEEQEKIKAEFGDFFQQVSAILFRHDPEKIAYPGNEDEYDSETATILPRLKTCHSAEDCCRVVPIACFLDDAFHKVVLPG